MAPLETQRETPTNTFKTTNPLVGTVLENHRLTPPHRPPEHDTRHMVLSSPGLSYLPGQSVGVIPEGIAPHTRKPHQLRLYSVSSESKGDYGDWKSVSIVVVRHFWDNAETRDRHIPGICSKYLCDCEVGEEVRITGPVGRRFILPADFHKRDMIFVATGTGIAPYRGMLKEMFDQGYEGSTFLFFGVRYTDTLVYDEEFRSYLDRPNFHYLTALSRESPTNPFFDEFPTPGDKLYVHIRMWQRRHELRESLAKQDTLVYVCGVKGMETGIFQVIDRIGELTGEVSLSTRMKGEGRLLLEVY